MNDSNSIGDDGWHLVVAHPATEVREEKQIEEWERAKGHWSGVGKHPTNWTDHKLMRVQDADLGVGSYGRVQRITYRTVTMARKHVRPIYGKKMDELRDEANAMERLAHRHVLKLVGTYTVKRNDLYLLLYPVAVCDLSRFLEDIEEIRSGTCSDREDAMKRLYTLGLKDIGTIEDLAVLRLPVDPPKEHPATATAVGFLQQILGCITEALAYVHGKGIRHKDLKPNNILLCPGRVYLADFGIAKDVREREDSLTSGRYGSLRWMAPEVDNGEEKHSMAKADVWSLGYIFLNVATILYGGVLEKQDQIMRERKWSRKYELLPRYMQDLQRRAKAASLDDYDRPNFNAKNLIGLIEKMLRQDPHKRPTASEVNAHLSEFGGLDQIYHLSCCHKKNLVVSELINKKLESVHQTNTASLNRISNLEEENARIKERILEIERVNKTFEERIVNERKHAGDQYNALRDKYEREIGLRKSLEEKLKAVEQKTNRWPSSQVRSNRKRSTRTIPLTPNRPTLNRESQSGVSTLASSADSTFSRRRRQSNESMSSVGSDTVRSPSPGSPTIRPPVPRVLSYGNRDAGADTRTSTQSSTPSWANLVARTTSKV